MTADAPPSRERRLTSAFVTLADTLVDDYDVFDLLDTLVHTSADVLDAQEAGLLLADASGTLSVVASTSERSHLIEIMQLEAGAGPCVECFVTGRPVDVADISEVADRWPAFHTAAAAQGIRAVHAVPLRLRDTVIGALNLFRTVTGELGEADIAAAQGLADVATIGILQERRHNRSEATAEQLQSALESRVVIEQAKGVLAYRHDLDMDAAFVKLRTYARNNSLSLRSVADAIVERSLRL
ncbi:ANTAR domain-containing protein [Marisediminicola sp. LYQ134]|uniref:ANTAR domain-containing protein n=1 Tax=unclassified Marisediminicola TaxID=2618316 RepID=UPI0039830A18